MTIEKHYTYQARTRTPDLDDVRQEIRHQAGRVVDAKAKLYMNNDQVSYGEAVKAVCRADSKLTKDYLGDN